MKNRILAVVSWLALAIMLCAGAPSYVSADITPSITLAPMSGAFGAAIAITGSGFTPNTAGFVWLDTNGNGVKDTGETSRAVSTTAKGEIPRFTRLNAPKFPGGTYKVICDIPSGGALEAQADFTITASLSLSLKTGYAGTKTTISGNGFAANASSYLWFDTNNNGKRDDGEPQILVTASSTGEIPAGITLTTPVAGPATYKILAAIPDGDKAEASAQFVYAPTLILSPSPVTTNLGSVVMDTVITISVTGGGFTPNSSGYIWFDYNKNDTRDDDESQAAVTVDANGMINPAVTLVTPKLPPCTSYNVEADIPGSGKINATAILDVAETTTSVTITKHDPYGNTISSRTVSWEWMKANLPVIGDGKTEYYIQKGTAISDNFDDAWDPNETDIDPDTLLDMGNPIGTDVKDLLNLVGGASKGDSILFTASDNWKTWFDYENIYFPQPSQGKVVLSWWNGSSGGYVPDFYLGMRLYCFAETTNAAGMHLFGDWDMHECMASSRWEYSPIGGASSRLSDKYVRYVDIYEPNLYPCDSSGKVKNDFANGETVYAKGLGLAKNTPYKLWIQPDGVQISPIGELDLRSGDYVFSAANDPSGSQEMVTTDAKGDFAPVAIWKIDTIDTASKKYDIAADNQVDGTVGTFDTSDAVANPGWEGFNAPSKAQSAGSDNWKIICGVIAGVIVIAATVVVIIIRRRSRPAGKQ